MPVWILATVGWKLWQGLPIILKIFFFLDLCNLIGQYLMKNPARCCFLEIIRNLCGSMLFKIKTLNQRGCLWCIMITGCAVEMVWIAILYKSVNTSALLFCQIISSLKIVWYLKLWQYFFLRDFRLFKLCCGSIVRGIRPLVTASEWVEILCEELFAYDH